MCILTAGEKQHLLQETFAKPLECLAAQSHAVHAELKGHAVWFLFICLGLFKLFFSPLFSMNRGCRCQGQKHISSSWLRSSLHTSSLSIPSVLLKSMLL